uniref:Probable ATP-dependent RNA helicase spindle-E n=1 Tax=Strigamia maritima TaxID=126957 RepID=T1JGF2_STRMM
MASYRPTRSKPRKATDITADDLLDCLRIDADIPHIVVQGARVKAPLKGPNKAPIKSYNLSFKEKEQYNYIDEYLKEEKKETIDQLTGPNASANQTLSQMSEIEEESVCTSIANLMEPAQAFNKDIDFTHRYNPDLPTTRHKDEILEGIKNQQVLIIEGSTGSGKTTQVPQFILDYHQERNEKCNIVVTQPRRIAAISIAVRVCKERNWNIGDLVGYKVGMDKSKVSRYTCLTYMTTGVFLKQLVSRKNMDDYTHVILDEVHERDQEMDFVLLVVKKFLRTCSRQVRVILMSASFDVTQFGRYFSMPYHGRLEQPTCLNLQQTKYTVSEYWLNDLDPLGELPIIDETRPRIDDKALHLVCSLIKRFDMMECDEQNQASGKKFAPNRGGVLIFLPGIDDIKRLDALLDKDKLNFQWTVLTLHSSLTDQAVGQNGLRVFMKPNEGQRKVILSTNIAESSITVSDIVYGWFIDFCLTKNLVCDRQTNYTSLQMEWASKANCKQRKGRTGRIGKGRVYRMVPENFFRNCLPEYATPEMKRCPLESIILHTKILQLGEPKSLLALALDPPKLGDIERSVLTLKEIGALDTLVNGKFSPWDGDLTFLGKVLSELPVDIHVGKLIILGFIFGFFEECLVIGAGLSITSLFANPYGKELDSWTNKVSWSDRSFSDCFAILHVHKAWKKRRQQLSVQMQGLKSDKEWANYHSVLPGKLREMDILIDELTRRLERVNIGVGHQTRDVQTAEDMLTLKILLAGAFYPHFFVRGDQDEREIAKSLSGKNPCTTVVLSGLPLDQGFLYKHDIDQMFPGYKIISYFESSRCFVEFQRSPNQLFDGLILPAVYMAVKRRQLREKFTLLLLTPDSVRKQMQAIEIIKEKRGMGKTNILSNKISLTTKSDLDKPKLPPINRNMFYIKVIWQPNRAIAYHSTFWAQYSDNETEHTLARMIGFVNENSGIKDHPPMCNPITPGTLCLAPCSSVRHTTYASPYCRARIEEVHSADVIVTFYDYGFVESVQKVDLRPLDIDAFPVLECPALAFEFALASIKPRAEHIHTGWSAKAVEVIKKSTEAAQPETLHCIVYSVVQRVVNLELIIDGEIQKTYINQLLLDLGLAEIAEESYLSKQNHGLRENFDEYTDASVEAYEEDDCLYLGDVWGADRKHTQHRITLKGPYSPLEVTFTSLQKCGAMKPVKIDMSSVNSVVLDAEPQDTCARMMVAATVGFNSSNDVMLVRNTTLLPNIHNLPALVSMLFAPEVEMRCNSKFSRYTGVLCGLGYEPRMKTALYEEHDMEIAFDTEITEDDLMNANALRMTIHGCLRQTSLDMVMEQKIYGRQNDGRKLLRDFLCKQRRTVVREYYRHSFEWSKIPEKRVMYLEMDDEDLNKLLIKGIRFIDPDLYAHLKSLKEMDDFGSEHTFQKVVCRFCKVTISSLNELKIHLKLVQHRNEVRYFLE